MPEITPAKWFKTRYPNLMDRVNHKMAFFWLCRQRVFIIQQCPLILILVGISMALLSTSSCQNQHNSPLFTLLPPDKTGIDFSNMLEEDDSFNIIQYLYYYNGGGVAVGDLNNDGYPDIYLSSNRNANKLYINQSEIHSGNVQFKDVTDETGVGGFGNWSTGVNIVDINSDGWLDIYLCQVDGYKGFRGRNQLFINQGCNPLRHDHANENNPCIPTFKEEASRYGLDYSGFASHSAFFDYDLDGDLDMYLLCHSVHSSESYRDTATTRLRSSQIGDKLFENRTGETTSDSIKFIDVSEHAGIYGGIAGYGLGLAIGDIDQNGYPDIYVGNDFHENDFLYLNQGNGTFLEIGTESMSHTSYFSMGNDLADINNDGWLDIMTLDMKPDDEILFKSAQGPDPYDIYRFKRSFGYHHQFPQNTLQVNTGEDTHGVRFSECSQIMGVSSTDWSWSVLMADFDLDGWKDLYITNGIPRRPNNLDYLKFISNREIQENASDLTLAQQMPSGKVSNYAFMNNRGNHFHDQTKDWGLDQPSVSHGAAYADFDLDGDLDLIVNNLNASAFYYQNNCRHIADRNYLRVKFKGPKANPFGIGAAISIYTGSDIQYQELYCTKGWQSAMDHSILFGLDTHQTVDSLMVKWPDSRSQTVINIEANQILSLDYVNAGAKIGKQDQQNSQRVFSHKTPTNLFTHIENEFFDNTREPLMPYLLSTQGPKVAVSDVNGDKLQDFFIGGASGQAGALFIQKSDAVFMRAEESTFADDTLIEDTGICFFDADGDGDQDLFIGSGGNQYHSEASRLADRLYFNDGSGAFSKRVDAIPNIYEQTSCVKPHDFDADGDMDLFVGSRSVAPFYGRSPDSHLLVNNGDGHFELATNDIIDLVKLGMVTDATWTDVDQDGIEDLVIVGDWMPVTVFRYTNGRFHKSTPPEVWPGWWNIVIANDLDKDGDQDLVLGNLGLNSNLKATQTEPLNLYIDDFDKNLTPDPIITYFKQGKEFPILGLDALASQLVFLKKKFRSYNLFAEKSINEIFSKEQLSRAQKKQVTRLQSSVAMNDGEGNFEFRNLPMQVQNSSVNAVLIFDVNNDHFEDILLAGNFYDVQPAIGRLDASFGTLLLGTSDGWFKEADKSRYNLSLLGQVRDLQLISVGDQEMILVAKNDAPLECIEINPIL